MFRDTNPEVCVVGAGPTGLLLAVELALAGVRTEVLDRLAEPDLTVKGASIRTASADLLDRRGLAPALRAAHNRTVREMRRAASGGTDEPGAGHPPAGPRIPVGGHFAAMPLRPELVDQEDSELRAHLATADAVLVPQRDLEAILGGHAAALGARVHRGVEVTGLHQDANGVTLDTSAGPRRARWVVGADGGRGVVRKLAGIGFPGADGELTGYQAIADLAGAAGLRRGWNWTPRGVYSYGPQPGRVITVQFGGPPADRDAPVTAQEVQSSLRHVSGTEVSLTALRGIATRWTDNARHATTYRRGRVLLAGDAAHVHSPFGGQGINLGLGDAANLGWKLAATIRGWAPGGLLDTYEAERRPVAAWVLDWTKAQVALMRGDEKTADLRRIVEGRLLGTRAAMTEFVFLTAGIGQRYAVDGSSPAGTVEAVASGEPGVPGARAGRLLGDVVLANGGRLADRAHWGTFVLLDRTPGRSYRQAAAPWADRVTSVTDTAGGLDGILVRPDGVVIWTADQGSVALTAAMGRWAGKPAGAVRP